MQIDFSPKCHKQLQQIKKRNPRLFLRITRQLHTFQKNPQHPSLRLHKLSGTLDELWSISITYSIRIVFYYRQKNNQQSAVFIAVGTHQQVYN